MTTSHKLFAAISAGLLVLLSSPVSAAIYNLGAFGQTYPILKVR